MARSFLHQRLPATLVLISTLVATAADWPQWMGPNRDDDWTETRIIESFPDGGPKEGATFVTRNGRHFFIFGENGDLVIARLLPERYQEVSRTHLLDPVGTGLGRSVVWSHPANASLRETTKTSSVFL